MRKIEDLIPIALDAAKKFIAVDRDKFIIPKQFKGYISSFGSSIIQSGMLPTLAFYSDAKKSKGDRSMLIPALIYILLRDEKNCNESIGESLKNIYRESDISKRVTLIVEFYGATNFNDSSVKQILEEISKSPNILPDMMPGLFNWLLCNHSKFGFKRNISNASVALKLALRTFKESDS